jgi:hypothetical protein
MNLFLIGFQNFFKDEGDYLKLSPGDEIEIDVSHLGATVTLSNKTRERRSFSDCADDEEK